MKFSVIIPAHNSAAYIQKALVSVVDQTLDDYELIVVCDSCDDNTADVASIYTDLVEEVKFGNDGLSRSRGLDMAQGEYVMFIDDDDWWLHPYVLEIVDRDTANSPEVDCYCYGFIWGYLGYRPPNGNTPGQRLFPNVWSKVWKRSTIGETRFPNVYYCSDMHFTNAMFDKPINYKLSNDPIYFYNYMREGSISALDPGYSGG